MFQHSPKQDGCFVIHQLCSLCVLNSNGLWIKPQGKAAKVGIVLLELPSWVLSLRDGVSCSGRCFRLE